MILEHFSEAASRSAGSWENFINGCHLLIEPLRPTAQRCDVCMEMMKTTATYRRMKMHDACEAWYKLKSFLIWIIKMMDIDFFFFPLI